jgi:hypothetical protein
MAQRLGEALRFWEPPEQKVERRPLQPRINGKFAGSQENLYQTAKEPRLNGSEA